MYRIKPYKHPRLKFVVRAKLHGKWVRKYFRSKGEVQACCQLRNTKLANQSREAFEFPFWLRVMAAEAHEQLALHGKTIADAVTFYLEHLAKLRKSVPINPAIKELIENLQDISVDGLEIEAEIDAKDAPIVELNVLRSPQREEYTRILLQRDRAVISRFMPPQQKLSVVTLDNTRSSRRPDSLSRSPETANVLTPKGEPFKLRIFVDRGLVEVFINGRQALALRVHPARADSIGVSLLAQGQDAELKSLTA